MLAYHYGSMIYAYIFFACFCDIPHICVLSKNVFVVLQNPECLWEAQTLIYYLVIIYFKYVYMFA